jgi:hypothetical protein
VTWQEELAANIAASAAERQAAIAKAKAAPPQEPAGGRVKDWNEWRRIPAEILPEVPNTDPATMSSEEKILFGLKQKSARHPKPNIIV